MTMLLTLPIIIPMLTGVASLLAYRSRNTQRWFNVSGAAALLAVAVWLLIEVNRDGILAAQIGNWPAPFGITLVADLFSAIMVVLAGIIGFAVAVYSLGTIDAPRETFGFHQLYHFLLMGVCGAFLTGDLFNLYVWFEVMLMSSFVLLALGGERGQMEGAIKYVTLNLMSSAIFLAALGLLYGMAGTLNMADLAKKISSGLSAQESGLVTTLAILFMVAFGIKAAVFPLFFWLPASYHTPPAPVSAVFAGLLTKVGVYALIRVFTLIFVWDIAFTHHTLLLFLAGMTMTTGVLGAVAQGEFRRVLSFHIISQIGYMVMGLGLFTPLALAGSVFYITHHIIVKTNLFLVSGVVKRLHGTLELKKLGGLYQSMPLLGMLFLVPALSLAGIPPLSGFFAKLSLVQAGLAQGQYFVVAVSLAVSLLTIFSMMKLWNEAFWKKQPEEGELADIENKRWTSMLLPIAALAVITITIGLGASPAFDLALRAGEQLMDPTAYIQAVLENVP
ncbi:MAG TPA: Na+/H+ antiporter subunit D [Anaerolineales bacterium]|nr:Na+/H+ antiporter subunit D [Anaerolineales bacterium]